MANTSTTTAQAHGRFIRGSASKVRRVLDQIRGRSYRDALIMLEFMPYRSTGPITKVLREFDRPDIGHFQPGDQVYQRRLTRARKPKDRHEFALGHVQRDVFQHLRPMGPRTEPF